MNATGTLRKILEKIKTAKTPERFTQDFLSTGLSFPGGSPRSFIPVAKRLGLLTSDGTPTDLYRKFRNPSTSGAAMADAMRRGYAKLFDRNEYAHKLDSRGLQGLIMEETGLDSDSKTLGTIVSTFNALKSFADFDSEPSILAEGEPDEESGPRDEDNGKGQQKQQRPPQNGMPLGLSYAIYLNLPATENIAVFNAIFKSLRENLLKQ
jgi:hypothetical protein